MASLINLLYPQGIKTVTQRQIGRMPEYMHALLPGAALIGRQVDPLLLSQLIIQLGLNIDLSEWFVHAVAAVILKAHKEEWHFVDDTLRQAFINALTEVEKRRWHKHIAIAIEAVYPDDASQSTALAFHWQQIGDNDKERLHARIAGEYAYKQYDFAEALQYLSRALELTAPSELLELYEIRLIQEKVYHLQGQRDAQKDELTTLAELADRLATELNIERRSELALELGSFAEVTGQYSVALIAATEAIHISTTNQIPADEAAGYLLWGQVLLRQGKYEQATERLQYALAQAQAHDLKQLEADSLRFLGVGAVDLSQFTQATTFYEAALAIYQSLQDRSGQSTILNNLGVVAYSQNQLVAAINYWEESLKIHQLIGDQEGKARVLSNLSTVYMDLGDYETARAYSEEAVFISRAIDLRFGQCFNLINLSLISYYLQEDQHAETYSLASLQVAREMESRPLEGMALKDRGYLLTHHQRWEDAEDVYQQALAIWQDFSQPLQILETQNGLARVALLRGDMEQAQLYIQPVVDFLQAGNKPVGTSRPFYIYLVCYEILHAAGEPYADTLLQQAHDELSEYAQNISDDLRRQAFFQNVPDHHRIRNLFNTQSDNNYN